MPSLLRAREALWTYYNASLKPWLIQQGTQYVLAPNAAGHVGPAFAQFFNHAAEISSALYSSGGNMPAFTFTLRSVPSKGVDNATLVVDGQRIPAGATAQQFTWNGATAHQASLAYNSAEALQFQGPWALFQLVADGPGNARRISSAARVSPPGLRSPNSCCRMVLRKSSASRLRVPELRCWRPWDCMEGIAVVPVTK